MTQKFSFTILMLICISLPVFCKIGGTTESSSKTSIPMTSYKIRPKDNITPDNIVDCNYIDGYLSISFLYPEGNATLKITRCTDGATDTATFSTLTQYIYYIGVQQGAYHIEINTSHNMNYTGILSI